MIDKSINFHDVLMVNNCKSIKDEGIVLGKGDHRTPVRTITIYQTYDGHEFKTELNLFGHKGKDTVPMEV